MLDERKAKVLRAVVEEYIETAQPVGSGHVAAAPGINVSAATVRNDMAVLEQEGYLHQPHTSAGRVPTEKGYRFFVDALGRPSELRSVDADQVRSFFASAHGGLETMLSDTSRLLTHLTHYAAVVVGPEKETAVVRSVQLVGLSARVALVVVVLSNGAVDKHTLEFDEDVDDLRLSAAGVRLAGLAVGHPVAELRDLPDDDEPMDAVLAAALETLRGGERPEQDRVFIGGTSEMASAFDAVGTVAEILRILEHHYVVVSLLDDVLGRGLNVAIGTETGIEPLADCSVVVAPYTVDGENAGTIGVLGPTRMNYPQALAAVAVVSRRLSNRLSEGHQER
ncbi:MAG: heat-inducible transcriptional repressor HrcA [Acidimicrobiales bacterium]|jgi:heat-inducible transcriptional repressor|nr:heat-inducible transcriptional repressor HrcA [Acidimicrobiales bacterium]